MTFYTLSEAAKILKVSKRTVQRAAHRIGKKKGGLGAPRFTEEEIKRMAGVS